MLRLLGALRKEIEHKGCKALMQFGKELTNSGSKKPIEAKKDATSEVAVNEESIALNSKQTKELAKHFQKDPEGGLKFQNAVVVPKDEFDGEEDRLMKANMHFKENGTGKVVIEELRGSFNFSDYPKYNEGKMTKEELFREILLNEKRSSPFSLNYSRMIAKVDDENNFSFSTSRSTEHIF